MPYFLNDAALGDAPVYPVHQLFAELWLNILESRSPMALGPLPCSLISLLLCVRDALGAQRLRTPTILKQVHIAATMMRRLSWVRTAYPASADLAQALDSLLNGARPVNTAAASRALNAVLAFFADSRVSSHVEHILQLPESDIALAAEETRDLAADLISLGHSESFLYGWGRAIILGDNTSPTPPLQERLARFAELGHTHRFLIAFRVAGKGFLPHSHALVFGKGIYKDFDSPPSWSYEPGDTGALASVEAMDYKAAIEKALLEFDVYRNSLAFSKRVRQIRHVEDSIFVRCQDDKTELVVDPTSVRPYEPPPLLQGNSLWLCRSVSPRVVPALQQSLYWLSTSRDLHGEAEFLALWLALVALFETDDVDSIVLPLARYRLATYLQLLVNWIADYLGKARQMRWSGLTGPTSRKLCLDSKREQRLQPIAQATFNQDPCLTPLKHRPLLRYRLEALAQISDATMRAHVLELFENELRVILPWVKSMRDSVAHLASTPLTMLDLTNQRLREDVTIAFDQVASSALVQKAKTLRALHAATVKGFDKIIEAVLAEPCLSPLHVRQGLTHESALPLKSWAF
jgi:hypothetical protein